MSYIAPRPSVFADRSIRALLLLIAGVIALTLLAIASSAQAHGAEFAEPQEKIADLVALPVAARDLPTGQALTGADITFAEIPARRAHGMVVDMDLMLGQALRRPLRAGEPVRAADLRPAITIRKGALVTIVLSGPGMELSVQGKALDDGAVNQPIRVVNTASSRIVDAVVAGPGRVEVKL